VDSNELGNKSSQHMKSDDDDDDDDDYQLEAPQ